MSDHSATLGLVLWLGAVPLLMWAGLDGPALAALVTMQAVPLAVDPLAALAEVER